MLVPKSNYKARIDESNLRQKTQLYNYQCPFRNTKQANYMIITNNLLECGHLVICFN